jgi:hypothetical protein
MVCLVDLPESAGMAVSKLRDYLQSARDKLVGSPTPSGTSTTGQFQPLKTPKEAADWLIKHRDEIAMWGIDDPRAKAIIKHKPQYITVGIEPGGGAEGAEKLKSLLPQLRDLPEVKDAALYNKAGNLKRNNILDDEMQKVNNYKLAMELSNYLSSQNSEFFGKGYNMILTDYLKQGLDPEKFIKHLEDNGVVQNGIVGDIQKMYTVPKGGKAWGRGNKLLAEGAGINPGTFMGLLNPSGSWKPMAEYSQFSELFKQAGYTKEQTGPFSSQKEWLKYSANAVKDQFSQILSQAKPEFMYLANAGKDNEALVSIIKTEAKGGGGTFTVSTKSGANKPVTRKIEYFLYDHPDGTRTVLMAGPHPSTLAFGSQESLVKATGEIAKSLRLTGTLPKSVSDLKVEIQQTGNFGGLKKQQESKPAVSDKSIAKSQPLVGEALLAKAKGFPEGTPLSDIVRSAGYARKNPDGTERLNFTGFYEALLSAKEKQTALTVKNQPEEQRAKRYEEEAKKAGLDRFEKKALQQWTSPRVDDDEGLAHFQRVNNALREGEDEWSLRDSGDKSQKKLGDDIQNLDYALGKLPKNSARETFYRAIRFDPEDELGWEDFKGLRPGDVINDPGFTSYSASKNVAKTFYSAYGGAADGDNKVLFVSKNSEITPINAFADKETKHEAEALLPRGQSSTVSWVKEGSDPKGGKVMIIGLDYD